MTWILQRAFAECWERGWMTRFDL